MVLIFSGSRIDGLEGVYASPNLASRADMVHADLIYTDNKRIIDMAKEFNIEVRDFPKHPPASAKKEEAKKAEPTTTTAPKKAVKKEQPLMDVLQPVGGPVEEKPTTIADDIKAGMADAEIMAKHNISKRKLNAEIKKIQKK